MKVLFAFNQLARNGISRSLLSMLQLLIANGYEVSLFLYSHDGGFFSQLSPSVRLLPEEPLLRTWHRPCLQAVVQLLKQKQYLLAFRRFVFSVIQRFSFTAANSLELKILKAIPEQADEYDMAISFNRQSTCDYILRKVRATYHIAWIHGDYHCIQYNRVRDREILAEMDHICCVSHSTLESVRECLSLSSEKLSVIHNPFPLETVLRNAGEQVASASDTDLRHGQQHYLVSVCRVCPQKGSQLIHEIAEKLVLAGCSFFWEVIGDGNIEQENQKAAQKKLSKHLWFSGGTNNPYYKMARAECYIQPSTGIESWGITVQEALALERRIVATDIPAFREQIVSGENGFLVPWTPEAFAEAILACLQTPEQTIRQPRQLFLADFMTEWNLMLKQLPWESGRDRQVTKKERK